MGVFQLMGPLSYMHAQPLTMVLNVRLYYATNVTVALNDTGFDYYNNDLDIYIYLYIWRPM